MERRNWLAMLLGLAIVALVASLPVMAQVPTTPSPMETDPQYKTYVDTLTYWLQYYFKDDWQSRLTQILVPAPDQLKEEHDEVTSSGTPTWVSRIPGSERVVFTGLPDNSWWIDAWRQDLNGKWVKVSSWHPSDQLPGPVAGDMAINGKLPAPYVIRVHAKDGSDLLGGPRLILVTWTNGGGGTWAQEFNVPTLPMATQEQLSGLTY
jgi:hypothetical protein